MQPLGSSFSKEERRKQLVHAALECIGQSGYHGAQIADIIRQAGVARGTFYLYFKSKRDIFDAVLTELFERVKAEIKALPKDAVNEIPEQIKGNIQRVLHLLRTNPMLMKILMSASVGLDADLDDRLREFYGLILDYIRRGLKQGQEMGFVREGHVPVLAVSLLGCIKEVLYQLMLGTEVFDESTAVDEIFRTVVGAVVHPSLKLSFQSISS